MTTTLRQLYALVIRLAKGTTSDRYWATLIAEAINLAIHCYTDKYLAQALPEGIAKISLTIREASILNQLAELMHRSDFVVVAVERFSAPHSEPHNKFRVGRIYAMLRAFGHHFRRP